MRSLSFMAALGALMLHAPAAAQPVLSHAEPGAVRPGKTVELTLRGSKLGDPIHLWTSFPARVERIDAEKKDASRAKWRLTVATDVPVGIGAVRVATGEGVSNLLLLLIDDLSSVADNGQNHAPDKAQAISPPVAVDGVCDGTVFDYYRFKAKAGQRLSVEAIAQRIGSPLDPVVRLLDAAGRQLVFADDDDSFGADPRFTHTFKHDGDYRLEVRDVQYRGGAQMRYRLRVGDFPLVSCTYPLTVKAGTKTQVRFIGPAVNGVPARTLQPLASAPGNVTPISATYPGGSVSGFAIVGVDALDNVLENHVSNDAPDAAQKVNPPCALNGLFERPKDRDYFQFTAKKGQRWRLTPVSRRLGSPSYVYIRVLRPDGSVLVETPDSNPLNAVLTCTIPADGVYRIMVEDLLRGGGPTHVYRVAIEPVTPAFSLRMKAGDRYHVAANGTVAIDVECQRSGYDGPVTLTVQANDPSGTPAFTLRRAIIGAKQNATRLVLSPTSAEGAAALYNLRIVGAATIDGKLVSAVAHTDHLLRTRWPSTPYPPAWLDGAVAVGVGAPLKPFFKAALKPESAKLSLPARPDKATAKSIIQLQRVNKGFKDKVDIIVEGLPPGLLYTVKQKGQSESEAIELLWKHSGNLPVDKHTLRVFVFGQMKAGNRQIGYGVDAGTVQFEVTNAEPKPNDKRK